MLPCGMIHRACHRTAFIECQSAFEEAVTKRQHLATQRGILEEETGLHDLSTLLPSGCSVDSVCYCP